MIVHLNGWPGVGKKTIGAVVAKTLGARLIDNHLLHDVAIGCAGFDSPERWTLYEQVRAAAYSILSGQPTNELFVMTNALCKNAPRELDAWRHVVELAVSRNVPLIPVVLEAELDENIRRLQSADRTGKKMTDPTQLKRILETDTIQYPDVPELFILDVTRLSAEEAAGQIADHVQHLKSALRPASTRHLQLR